MSNILVGTASWTDRSLIASGRFYPSLGLELRPEWAALLMALSSIIVATNAVLLKRAERDLVEV